MKRPALCAALLTASGCSAILGLEDGEPLAPDAGVIQPDLPDASVVSFLLFVDPAGDDDNDGTRSQPFRSITKAVSASTPGSVIEVADGTYNESNGEIFPIDVTALDLEIRAPNLGATVATVGGSVLLFDLGPSSLSGFSISTGSANAVRVGADGRVENCTIQAMDTAILTESIDVVIRGNTLTLGGVGIELVEGGTGASREISGNVIRDNNIGIDAVLASGSDVQMSGNEISCNVGADVRVALGSVSSTDDRWDHVPPTAGNFGGGIDTTVVNGGDIFVDNPILADGACP